MASFWELVNKVISESDIVLEVLDARLIDETRNIEIENKVKSLGKTLIYVLNKSDLVPIEQLQKQKKNLRPCVFVSSTKHQGTIKLREAIKKCSGSKKVVVVGVVGYPNSGKSALINALKGRSSAPTSAQSGYTKGVQKVSIGGGIVLLDTPGVIPYQEKDAYKHALTSAVDPFKVKEPDFIVAKIMEQYPGRLEEYYGVKPHKDPVKTIEEIAIKRCRIKKGSVPDIDAMSRTILRELHSGKINQIRENAKKDSDISKSEDKQTNEE